MPIKINADKPHLWKADTRASVNQFNVWFMAYAPKAYRDTRGSTVQSVEQGLRMTADLTTITPEVIKQTPAILRRCACPPAPHSRATG